MAGAASSGLALELLLHRQFLIVQLVFKDHAFRLTAVLNHESTIHKQHGSGDESRLIREQPGHRMGHISGNGHPSKRM